MTAKQRVLGVGLRSLFVVTLLLLLVWVIVKPTLALTSAQSSANPASAATIQWQPAGLSTSSVTVFAFDRQRPGTIYVVSGGDAYSTTNGGIKWDPLNNLNSSEASDSFAIDPSKADILWAPGVHGVSKSINRGQSWTKYQLGLANHTSMAINPVETRTVFVGGTAGWGIYRTKTGGVSWVLSLI